MNQVIRTTLAGLALAFSAAVLAHAQDTPAAAVDSQEVLKLWSLFSEYHRNGDHISAVPYGWQVINIQPARFKTIYQRMADCYYNFYEKAEGPDKTAFADTLLMIYDLGMKHVPERAPSFWLQKGFALENYFDGRDLEAIDAYEKALHLDYKSVDFAYVDRLGLLYRKNMEAHPEFKEKALSLYQRVVNEDPSNQVAAERLRSLASDPLELIAVYEKLLATDPDNIEYLWGTARANIQADQFAGAEKHLQKLVKLAPTNATYWNELARAQQRQRKFREAIDSYERALKLNPALKDNNLYISGCYRELRNYAMARTYAQRAAASERGWGRPHIEIAEIYKATVEDCVMNTKGGDWSKLDINDKLVYRLAQESYARARAVDPTVANEADRLYRDLNTLAPAREDYFFHRARIKDGKMEIEGPCYEWIREAVTVPSF